MKAWTALLWLPLGACAGAATPSPYRRAFLDKGSAREIAVAGHTLHVIDAGRGPAVLLLHGLGGSAYDFRFQIDPLVEAGYRVIVPDLLGAGYSEKPVEWEYTIPAQAELMANLLDALGVDKARVGGNSYGGGVAIALALAHPERVESLILIDAACYPQEMPWHLKMLRAPLLGEMALAFLPPRWAARTLFNECFQDPSVITEEEIVEYVHESRFTGSSRALQAMARRLDDPSAADLHTRIPELRMKTLILWGRHDKVVPVAFAERLHAEIAGSEIFILSEGGHVPHMEFPTRVNREILRFLGGATR